MQDYRRLLVWEKAHGLVLRVRLATEAFPKSGFASLKSQMTRSAESIAFNIVEGCGAASQREFARFLDIAIKSTMELEYQLKVALDYGLIGPTDHTALSGQTTEIRRMLYGLRRKVLAAI